MAVSFRRDDTTGRRRQTRRRPRALFAIDAAPMDTTKWSREMAVAQDAAKAAAVVLLAGWGERPSFELKSSATDLVTDFDRRAERAVLQALSAAFPDDGIVGEEGGRQRSDSGRTWHVDPLDGTTNFVHG